MTIKQLEKEVRKEKNDVKNKPVMVEFCGELYETEAAESRGDALVIKVIAGSE